MGKQKLIIRFFTDSDYLEEESWLREEHKIGLKLIQRFRPGIYVMEECEPKDSIYRKEFTGSRDDKDYLNLLECYGWEKLFDFRSWTYFIKDASNTDCIEEQEILTDNESKLNMVNHFFKTRIIPLGIVLTLGLSLLILAMISNGKFDYRGFLMSDIVIYLVWLYICLHSIVKIRRKKKELESNGEKVKIESTGKVTKVIVSMLIIGMVGRVSIIAGVSGERNIKNVDIDNTIKIVVLEDSTRKNIEVTDKKIIDDIISIIFNNKYKKMLLGPNAFMQYTVCFYDSNSDELAAITLVNEDAIYFKGHSYKIHSGNEIDIDYFKALLTDDE